MLLRITECDSQNQKENNMALDKIIAVTGKPGLFEIMAQSKGGFIVESLMDKKRFPITATHKLVF